MKPINVVRKTKERKIFTLDSVKELDNFKFSAYIPKEAKKIEIHYSERKGQKLLEIDYIVKFEVKALEKVNEVNENVRRS